MTARREIYTRIRIPELPTGNPAPQNPEKPWVQVPSNNKPQISTPDNLCLKTLGRLALPPLPLRRCRFPTALSAKQTKRSELLVRFSSGFDVGDRNGDLTVQVINVAGIGAPKYFY